jgi:hypothetical protein
MTDNNMPRSFFVDFMYAVVVGATIVRIDANHLVIHSVEFWGIWFLIAVFLEDFYLYHRMVVPNLGQSLTGRQLISEMLIVFTWYVGQVAFPTKMSWLFVSFASFFMLKLLAGILMSGNYPSRHDLFFLIPIITAIVLHCARLSVGFSVMCLFVAWFVAVAAWWWTVPVGSTKT